MLLSNLGVSVFDIISVGEIEYFLASMAMTQPPPISLKTAPAGTVAAIGSVSQLHNYPFVRRMTNFSQASKFEQTYEPTPKGLSN
jgi:hypothetical protein